MLGEIDIPRLNLTDLIKRDNSIKLTYEALLKEDAVNKLRFSSDSKTFPFDITDFDLLPDGIISSEKCIVKKYLHKPSRNIVAVKYVHIPHSIYKDLKKEKDMQKLIQEIKIHQQLSFSKHIVKLYGFCVYEGDALICMEIMDMSLKEFYMGVHQKYGYFSEDLLGVICVSIVHAFQDLHKVGIIHRDIKPNNILINSNSQIKLCDFGEARLLENNLATSIVGTVAYWPPERMEGKRAYDGRSDIWSLGITLAELVYGRFLFEDEDGNPLDNLVMVMCYIMRLNTDELVDKCFRSSKYRFAQDFVKACLKPWKQRPNYEDLLFTPFYKESCELSRHALIQQYYQSIPSPPLPSSTCSNTSSLKERRLNERINKNLKIITNIEHREFQLPKRYILGEIVDFTMRGVTRKAFDQKLNKNVAIRRLRFHYLKSEEAYREFVLLQILDHRNIIKLYDAFTSCETQFHDTYFVLEYLEYPLRALIYERQKIFDGQDGRLNMAYVLSQILAGVNYLHHIGIVHRDLSPDSIIVSKDFQLKIAHLGLVQALSEDRKELANYNTSICLFTQTYYRAPEVLLGFKYNYKEMLFEKIKDQETKQKADNLEI